MARIEEINNNTEVAIQDLDTKISQIKGQYQRAMDVYNSTLIQSAKLINEKNIQIDSILNSLDNITQNQKRVESETGLKGNVLVDFLTRVRIFAQQLGSAPVFQPLQSIISGNEFSFKSVI